MYDSWGSSWGTPSAWAVSWVHTTPPPVVVVIDTHDGEIERIKDYRRRKEELHEDILRAFEAVTGEAKTEIPTLEAVQEIQAKTKAERLELRNIREDIEELNRINESILNLSQFLQEREMQDIAFILGVL